MSYRHFALYNITGGTIWVVLFSYTGYIFGGLEIVQNNLKLLIILIIVLSILPAIIEVWKNKRKKKNQDFETEFTNIRKKTLH